MMISPTSVANEAVVAANDPVDAKGKLPSLGVFGECTKSFGVLILMLLDFVMSSLAEAEEIVREEE